MTVYGKTKSNTIISAALTALNVFVSTLLIPLIISRLGIDGWAKYSLFLVLVGLFSFVEVALQGYVVLMAARASVSSNHYAPASDRLISRVGIICFATVAFLILVAKVSIPQMAPFVLVCLLFALTNAIVRSAAAIHKGILQSVPSQARYYLISAIFNGTRPLVLFLYTVFLPANLAGLCTIYLTISILEYFAFSWSAKGLVHKIGHVPTSESQAASDLHLIKFLTIANFASVGVFNIDKAVSLIFSSIRLAGEYTLAASIAGLLLLFINSAISSFSPRFKELHIRNDVASTKSLLYRLSAFNSAFIAIAASSFLINFDYLAHLLHAGLDLNAFRLTFILLSADALMYSNLWIPGTISVSYGKPQFSFYCNFSILILYLLLLPLFLKFYAVSPFALTMAATSGLITCIYLIYFKRSVMDFSLSRYLVLSVLLPIAGSLILTTAVAYCLKYFGLTSLHLLAAYCCLMSVILLVGYKFAGTILNRVTLNPAPIQ